jgi:hypothetical protein
MSVNEGEEAAMAKKSTDTLPGTLESDEYDGAWAWVWTSPGGAEYRGNFEHDNEDSALEQGRAWVKEYHS